MTPDELYENGRKLLPAWNDRTADREQRRARAVELITQAADAGHVEAVKALADGLGGPDTLDWAVTLAQMGDVGSLVSQLTRRDWPRDRLMGVLQAAQSGEPWAQLAIGEVYGLGVVEVATGELAATVDEAFGFLPGVSDPAAECRRLLEAAAAGGWAAAALALAFDDRIDAPERALEHLRAAIHAGAVLTPRQRTQAGKLWAQLLDRTDAPILERIAAQQSLAEAGDDDAMTWLADRARRGEGVPKDLARARALYARPAELGNVDACRELGKLCEKGQGGPVDLDAARELYERAAELGADTYSRKRLVKKFGLDWYGT